MKICFGKEERMEKDEFHARIDPEDFRSVEETADTVSLLALDLAIQALERNAGEEISQADANFLLNVAERGMNLTGIMSRMLGMSPV